MDEHLVIADLDPSRTKRQVRRSWVATRAYVELVSMPRADDVAIGRVEVAPQAALLDVEALDDAGHDLAAANGTSLMRTFVHPGDQAGLENEDAHRKIAVGDHPSALGPEFFE
jgi:hypothetical protein